MGQVGALYHKAYSPYHSISFLSVTDGKGYTSSFSLNHTTSVDRSKRQGSPALLYKQTPISERRERAIMWGIILGLVLGAVFLCVIAWFILKITHFGKK